MSKPGWGAVLDGEAVDVDDWTFQLKEAFDPYVEVHGGLTVLRSASFDELTSASEVRDRATALIERLNGALALSQKTKPLRCGSVVEIKPDGSLFQTLFIKLAGVEARDRIGAVMVTVTGPNGEPLPPPPPQPSLAQQWIAVAESDELLDDALIYFGRVGLSARHPEATDWFDVYKALECLFIRFDGQAAFLKLNWAPAADIELLRRTANWARHARRRFDPPPNPMEFSDARTLLGNLMRRALSEAASRP